MTEVVIGEENRGAGAQAEGSDKAAGIENIIGGPARVGAEHRVHLERFLASSQPPRLLPQLLEPAYVSVVAPPKKRASTDERIDLAWPDRCDAKYLGYRQLREAPRAFRPVHAFFCDCSHYRVIVEESGGGIMRTMVKAQDQHRRNTRWIAPE